MENTSRSLRVLFIGNSFTYANDLDKVFSLFMHKRGVTVEAKRIAKGGYSFTNHVKDLEKPGEELYNLLGEGSGSEQRWDYVILQDQSQIPGTFRLKGLWEASRDALLQLAALATRKGATLVLLQTWAHREGNYDRSNPFFTQLFPDYSTMQHLLIEGYKMYKHEIEKRMPGSNVIIAPVGVAWSLVHDAIKEARAASSCAVPQNLFPGGSGTFRALYVEDNYHPSLEGTVLAAQVLVETLLSMPSAAQERSGNLTIQATPALDSSWVQFLQAVARTAVTHNTTQFQTWFQQQTDKLAAKPGNMKEPSKVELK